MIGSTTVGAGYPGLYAVSTHARLVVSDDGPWYVDTYRCVSFSVIGTPWTLPTTWFAPVLPPCLTFNPATAQICGAPMRVGVTPITLYAQDATGRIVSLVYTITVRPKP